MSQGLRYAVGIDLGTTHCVVSYLDTQLEADQASVSVFTIPQLTSPGHVESKSQLPSFMYLAHGAELKEGSTNLPWTEQPEHLVGEIARHLGSKTPARLVSSAKSWLCHNGVDCKQPILPTDAPEDVHKISPFLASKAYLQHLLAAWHHQFPDYPLSEQDVTITVPASFDPAARELTIEAAHAVGLSHATLLEEPQAALYSWIESSHGEWRKLVNVGDVILVVDVGGGTTDLSLIAVTEDAGNLQLTRVAVGDHILLGGDNMDLALAYTVKAKMEQQSGTKLENWQLQALTHACRDAKEKLLSNAELESIPLVIAGRGSSFFATTLRSELRQEELQQILVAGFLPEVSSHDKPQVRPRSGLRSAGLIYAQDAAITRHIAAFLTKQRDAANEFSDIQLPEHASFLHPTAVLFNGGVLKSDLLAQRLLHIINHWLEAEQAPHARLLPGADLDLAVARGAAYYGFVRKGKGVRIKGGTAAAYYVGVESAMPAVPGLPVPIEALCVSPLGLEEGSEVSLPNDEFGVIVGVPVNFRFFASKTRRNDQVGTRLDSWNDDELEELTELEVTLPEENQQVGELVPVHLSAAATEVGTLELKAVSRNNPHISWKIEFEVRES